MRSRGYGLAPVRRHEMATLALVLGYLLEIDELAAGAAQGVRPPGGLPAGVASVDFAVYGGAREAVVASPPHRGVRMTRVTGIAGDSSERVASTDTENVVS